MANTFDQFDRTGGNPFDQFDTARPETITEGITRTPGRMARSVIQGVAAIPNIIADPFYRMAGLTPPAQGLRESLTALGLPEYPTDTAGQISQAATEALAGAGGQINLARNLASQLTSQLGRGISTQFAAQPAAQMVAAPVAAGASEETFRRTGDPLLSTLAAVAAGAATGIRPGRTEPGVGSADLAKRAQNLYDRAESANLRVTPQYTNLISNRIAQEAKDAGFVPGLHPQVDAVLKALETEATGAKSLQDLDRLRRIVRAPEKIFDNPDQQRIASKMVDAYDEMIDNIKTSNISTTKEKMAVAALQEARKVYGQNKRLETIEDLVERADIRSGQFSQSGMDNALRVQFANLATNNKRMAAFSKTEQEQIKNIAKGGGTTEQMLRFVGKFAIRGPVTGIVTGGTTVASPAVGIPLALTSEAAKRGAEAMREQNIRKLMESISLGRTPESRMFELLPAATTRGLLSTQVE
jgi:hypothetical protein